MNKKIRFFGCSHTASNLLGYHYGHAGDAISFKPTPYTKYIGNRLGVSYPKLISDELGCEMILNARPGFSNDMIFDSLIDDLPNMKQDDVVIIQLTHFVRFDYPIKRNDIWYRDGWQINSDTKYTTNEYLEYFNTLTNFNEYFASLIINRIEKIVNYIYVNITKNIYVFSWDQPSKELLINTKLFNFINFLNINNKISIQDGLLIQIPNATIKGETNGMIDDTHLGEIGSKYLADFILSKIKS
jgi:hypothetical protein